MIEAETTAALVVGIDRYDIGPEGLPPLSGAVADAAAAVAWLQAIGVPNSRIFLHASPVDAPAAVGTGVAVRPAKELDIWGSIFGIGKLSGSRLFVFLFGHAAFEPRWKRLFFTQEFGENGNWANLSIDRYIDYFLSADFRRQFLVMDGCHNLPYPEDARGRIAPGFRGGEDVTPRAENSMVACFSCSQSERAQEIGGRGLFTRHLLEALAPASPLPDALQLDWTSGETSVDIIRAMEAIQPLVAQEAASAPGGQLQHPDYRPDGWPAPDRPVVMRITGDAVGLDVRVDPAADVPTAVQVVEVQAEVPPYWAWRWAPGGPSAEPSARLPKGLATRVACLVQAGWRCQPEQVRLTADADRTLSFQLSGEGGAGAPAGPVGGGIPAAPGTVEIQRLVAHQRGVGGWYATPYDAAARVLGLAGPPMDVGRGVTMFQHESGPEFHIRRAASSRQVSVVQDWRKALEEVTPPDVTYQVEVVETEPVTAKPELRLVLQAGGAVRLAGPLADQPSVWVGPAGADRKEGTTRSLRQVEQNPVTPAGPGPVRVTVELPWGSWSRVVDISQRGRGRVTLPASVGLPPLRAVLSEELKRATGATLIIGSKGSRPTGWAQNGLSDVERRPLKAARRGSASWALSVPDDSKHKESSPMPVVSLASGVRFPVLRGRAFGLDLSSRVLRAEPLSPVATPQWDLLVTTGRLDSLGVEERRELARGKWEDPILGLAVAYAIHVAGEWSDLETVLGNTRGLLGPTPPCDVDLLEVGLRHPRGGRLEPGEADRLEGLAAEGAVPAFRWGVALALDLSARARRSPVLVAWAAALRRVEERLSPLSIWTAWREGRSGHGRSSGAGRSS